MNLGQVRFRIVLGQYGLPAGQPTPECLYDEQMHGVRLPLPQKQFLKTTSLINRDGHI